MVTPRWVNTAAQPIAIEDVIEYLVAASRLPGTESRTFEIGGADVTSYVGIMREYARQRHLRRWIVRVLFLSLSLSSRWLTFITPVYEGGSGIGGDAVVGCGGAGIPGGSRAGSFGE